MRINRFICNSCGEEHPPQSDLIFGYTMRKMHLYHELKYFDKTSTQRHICLDCLNAFKREKHPEALDLKPDAAFISEKPLTKEETNKITDEWKRRYLCESGPPCPEK
jgi:hypothetical protein